MVGNTWHMQWRGPETLKFDIGGSNRESLFHLVSIFLFYFFLLCILVLCFSEPCHLSLIASRSWPATPSHAAVQRHCDCNT